MEVFVRTARYLFYLVIFIQASIAIQWMSQSQIPNGSAYRACLGERANFPWNYTLSTGEQTVSVEWYRTTEKGEFLLAGLIGGEFLPRPTAAKSVSFLSGAGIQVSNLNWTDFGTYTVRINYNSNGSLQSSDQTAILTMEDAPVLAGSHLVAQMLPEPVLDATTGALHVQLTCGTFLQLGSRPVSVVWKTPSGKTLASTTFSTGMFHLNLPHPVEGGGYTCLLGDPYLATRCMLNMSHLIRGAYIHVDEVQTRLMLLEAGMLSLQNVDKTVDLELDQQAKVDSDLQSREQILTSEVGRLTDFMQILLAQRDELSSDNKQLKVKTDKLMLENEEMKTKTAVLMSDRNNLQLQVQIMTSQISDEKASNAKLAHRVDVLETKTSSFSMQLQTLKTHAETSTRHVSFYARMHQKPISAGETLTSGNVLTNEGGAFDDKTGIFTVPVSGTYIFLINIATSTNSPQKDNRVVQLHVDGSHKASAISSYNSSIYISGSCHAVLQLNVGQKVSAFNEKRETQFWDTPTTFAGALLYPSLKSNAVHGHSDM